MFTLVSPLSTCFLLIMVAGGFGPYHRLWPDDAPSKCIIITPTSGRMIGVVLTNHSQPTTSHFAVPSSSVMLEMFINRVDDIGLQFDRKGGSDSPQVG
jgi:hypothetical protein